MYHHDCTCQALASETMLAKEDFSFNFVTLETGNHAAALTQSESSYLFKNGSNKTDPSGNTKTKNDKV